jgi:hypothetical protein
MIAVEFIYLWAFLMIAVGGVIIWRHGEAQYGKGIIDGINMLDSGRLQYESYYEGDQKYIKIDIKPEDEE